MFNAENFPFILGMELLRPRPNYIARAVFQPAYVWDVSAQPGEQVRLDRYSYFGDDGSLTEDARRRLPDQLIGAQNSRNLSKQELFISVDEYTGPGSGDSNNPNSPGNVRLAYKTIALAQQRMLYDPSLFNNPAKVHQFHQSIGSLTLLDDYQRWNDRIYINKAMSVPTKYNPGGVADGGTYASGPPKFDVNRDLKTIVEMLQSKNVPTFDDGYYRALVTPRFLKHLRQDDKFTEVARYPGFAPVETLIDPSNPYAPPMMPHPNAVNVINNPNMALFAGMLAGQSVQSSQMAQDQFPCGFVFEGVRFFVTNNIPNELVNLTYTSSTDATNHPTGAANRTAYPGLFFGKDLIGEAAATNEPVRCKVNGNDDYQRFLILIWQAFGGWQVLNRDFGIVARTYAD